MEDRGWSTFQAPNPSAIPRPAGTFLLRRLQSLPRFPSRDRFDGLASRSAIGNLALRVRPRLSGWASCLNSYFLYKKRRCLASSSAAPATAHFAARCATVAPHGDLQTLGEHGLLAGRFGRRARHGAPFHVFWRLWN